MLPGRKGAHDGTVENCQRVLLQAVMQAAGVVEGYSTQYLDQSVRQEEIRQAVSGKALSELMAPLGDLFCHRAICRVYNKVGIINQMVIAHENTCMRSMSDDISCQSFLLPPELLSTHTEEEMKSSWLVRAGQDLDER